MIAPRRTICQLLHGLSVGGAEVLVDRLARQLGHRYRFLFACLDEVGELGETLDRDGFPVRLLERRPGRDWRCMRRLANLVREERVDIVHAHQYTPFFYAVASRLMGARVPVLFTEHGRMFPDYPRKKRMIFNRMMLRRRDRVVGVGEAVRRALRDNEGIPASRVGVIYNGIGLPARSSNGEREPVRRELGVSQNAFLVLQVARLVDDKDHATAIAAVARAAAKNADVQLLIVGDGPERRAIESQIVDRGIGGHVRLLGLRRDVPRLLGSADACLLTSVTEGIPLTLIEGMAAGLPVVSTNVGGVPEVVNASTGLLTPPGDADALAEALVRLADDEELRRRLGTAGRNRAEAVFSETQMHAEYARLYDEMLCS